MARPGRVCPRPHAWKPRRPGRGSGPACPAGAGTLGPGSERTSSPPPPAPISGVQSFLSLVQSAVPVDGVPQKDRDAKQLRAAVPDLEAEAPPQVGKM